MAWHDYRSDTGILCVSCEGAWYHGGTGGFGNRVSICPATFHLVALDKLLGLFETWLSHLLMVPPIRVLTESGKAML